MQLSHILGGSHNTVHGKEFPMHSVILEADDGKVFVCANFKQPWKEPLKVYCYIPEEKKWVITFLKYEYKELMWDHYRKLKRKHCSHHKKHIKSSSKKTKGTQKVKIPSSVIWSMKHPFQGGGVSPR